MKLFADSLPSFDYIEKYKNNGLSDHEVLEKSLKKNIFLQQSYNQFYLYTSLKNHLLEPLILLLIVSGIIIFFAADPFDALIIAGIITLNVTIGVFQEFRINRMITGLKNEKEDRVIVLRQGKRIILHKNYLVVGDIIILQEGQLVPVNVCIIEGYRITVNEALLTGESEPVIKKPYQKNTFNPINYAEVQLLEGSIMTTGYAKAIVLSLDQKKKNMTSHADVPLQKDLEKVLYFILYSIVFICVGLFIIGYMNNIPFVELFSALIALFMCVVPQGLPIIMTLILAAGAYKMQKKSILFKKLQALESLGRAEVVVIDKTGTITKNELMVTTVSVPFQTYKVTGSGYAAEGYFEKIETSLKKEIIDSQQAEKQLQELLQAAALLDRSAISFDQEHNNFIVHGSALEVALKIAADKYGVNLSSFEKEYKKLYEIPFSALYQYHAAFYDYNGQGIAYALGAYEAFDKKIDSLSSQDISLLQELISNGIRVVMCIKKKFSLPSIDQDYNASFFEGLFLEKNTIEYLGMFGLHDTVRPHMSLFIDQLKKSGMSVVMATGDNIKTASHIADTVGILQKNDFLVEGKDLSLFVAEYGIEKLQVCARALPEDKVALVKAFQKINKSVLMIGDGVNDVPALQVADSAVVIDGFGNQLAKESASILIQNGALHSLIEAIHYGRHIFYTFKRVILYFFITNCSEVLVMLFSLGFGLPVPLLAVHILWLNLVTDGFLDTALSFEPLDNNLMRSDYFKNKELLFNYKLMIEVLVTAFLISGFSVYVFYCYMPSGLLYARTMAMVTLTFCQWITAYNCRTFKKSIFRISPFSNLWLFIALIGIVIVLFSLIYIPYCNVLFKTMPLMFSDWIVIGIIMSVLILVDEGKKFIQRVF